MRDLHLVTMLQWLNRCNKLQTNLTQLLTRALAWGISWDYHFALARDVRSGSELQEYHFILITDFLMCGFCTNVLNCRIWNSPSRYPQEKIVLVSTGQTCQPQETDFRSENTSNKGLPHGLNDCWVHGKKCQRTQPDAWARTKQKTHTKTCVANIQPHSCARQVLWESKI